MGSVAQRANRSSSNMLNLFFSSLLISSTLALVQPLPREQPETKDLLCDIYIDVITDLDQWLTSDSTEDQIVEWIEQVCDLLSAIVPEAICKSLIESQIPAIIDGLPNDNSGINYARYNNSHANYNCSRPTNRVTKT